MKKLLVIFFLGCSMAYGQRNFTIEETVTSPGKFAPKTIHGTQWITNQDAFSSLDSTFENLQIHQPKNNWVPSTILSKEDLQNALASQSLNEQIKIEKFPNNYRWIAENKITFSVMADLNNYTFIYDIRNRKIEKSRAIPKAIAENQALSNDTQTAYLKGNNIEILQSDGTRLQVTNDTLKGVINGATVHRNEFGIDQGMWWSPDEKKLLYYTKNENQVSLYPIPQWNTRVTTIKDIAYPMAGMKSEEVTLTIFNTQTGYYIRLKTGTPKEQYLTSVTWDPSNQFVYVGVLNRGQDHLKMNKYDANTGSLVKTLFEETSTSWVEPQHPLAFLPHHPKQFLYQSDRDGYNQLYLYTNEGELSRSLGFQDVVVTEFQGFNNQGTKAFYIGATNQGMERHLFEVDLKNGKTNQLTQANGTHSASISESGRYILDEYSNLQTPNEIQVIQTKNKQITKLLTAQDPFLNQITLPKIEFKTILAADGITPLNARITYPTNFDANKKYPVMLYLYGGSHAQLVRDKWLGGIGFFDLYMAQQGYLVFTIDNRGSDARDRDFTRVTHRRLGEIEMADQLEGINYLKSLSYVDSQRMGIFGWSFGGFMSTSFMTKHNDIFKAAVAGGPVIDWKYYEIMYGERYMDTPAENPQGYEETSLLNKADRLNGQLLIIHGAQDPVVVQQHSMAFIQKCIEAGKQVDYFLYPQHEHNVLGRDRIHMYDKIANYFNLHLK